MRSHHGASSVLLVLLCSVSLEAQQQQPQQSAGQQQAPAGDAGGGAGGATLPPPIYSSGSSIYQSSTAVEGAARGSASVIQAAGEYNYNTAAGMVAASQAESQGIANAAAALNNYFTLKKLNESYRFMHHGPKAGESQAPNTSRMLGPRRLTMYQFDPGSGQIKWPAILLRPEFAEYRQQLDDLFAQRNADNSGLGSPSYEEITYSISVFQDDLKNLVDRMTPMEYVSAKRFLNSLGYEAQFTPSAAGVTGN